MIALLGLKKQARAWGRLVPKQHGIPVTVTQSVPPTLACR